MRGGRPAHVAAGRRTAGQQHHLADPRLPGLGQRAGHVLIAAYIERADRLYREWFDAAAAAGGPDPRDQVLALFDALGEQVQPQHCRGCPFLMALAEFPDPAHPAHRAAVTMKTWVRDRLGQLTAALASGGRTTRPELLADQLSLIMEGTYASAQALTAGGPARHARTVAESLLDVS